MRAIARYDKPWPQIRETLQHKGEAGDTDKNQTNRCEWEGVASPNSNARRLPEMGLETGKGPRVGHLERNSVRACDKRKEKLLLLLGQLMGNGPEVGDRWRIPALRRPGA